MITFELKWSNTVFNNSHLLGPTITTDFYIKKRGIVSNVTCSSTPCRLIYPFNYNDAGKMIYRLINFH